MALTNMRRPGQSGVSKQLEAKKNAFLFSAQSVPTRDSISSLFPKAWRLRWPCVKAKLRRRTCWEPHWPLAYAFRCLSNASGVRRG